MRELPRRTSPGSTPTPTARSAPGHPLPQPSRPAPGPAALHESGQPGKPASAQDPAPRRPRSRCGARFARLPASALEGCTSQQGANRSWHRQRSRAHDEHTEIRRRTDRSRPRPRSGGPGSTPRLPPQFGGCGPWSQLPQRDTHQDTACRAVQDRTRRYAPGSWGPHALAPGPLAGAYPRPRNQTPAGMAGGGVLSTQCPHRARPGGIR